MKRRGRFNRVENFNQLLKYIFVIYKNLYIENNLKDLKDLQVIPKKKPSRRLLTG